MTQAAPPKSIFSCANEREKSNLTVEDRRGIALQITMLTRYSTSDHHAHRAHKRSNGISPSPNGLIPLNLTPPSSLLHFNVDSLIRRESRVNPPHWTPPSRIPT